MWIEALAASKFISQKSISRFTEERLHRNSERFNTLYGGLEPDVTNAVFVYGQHDPWSVIGRRTDLSDDAIAIVIPRKFSRSVAH